MEHRKTEVFYFSRLHRIFDLSLLDFMPLEDHVLCPKSI